MKRGDFQDLAGVRLQEAKALCDTGKYHGAYYLAGYAVECALKACIAKQTQAEEFPPSPEIVKNVYTHNLSMLVNQAGVRQQLEARMDEDEAFAKNWNLVKDWTEKARYEFHGQKSAEQLIDAIKDSKHGILPWLQSIW